MMPGGGFDTKVFMDGRPRTEDRGQLDGGLLTGGVRGDGGRMTEDRVV